MATKAAEQLRKITIATCNATPNMELIAKLEKIHAKTGDGRQDVLDVFGIAKKFKPGASDKGEFIRFIGQFKGVNLATGEVFISAAAIFPKMIEDALWGVMNADGVSDVQFAYRLGVKYDPKAATKYVYVAVPLTKPAENDALALLEKSVAETLKTLPAPK